MMTDLFSIEKENPKNIYNLFKDDGVFLGLVNLADVEFYELLDQYTRIEFLSEPDFVFINKKNKYFNSKLLLDKENNKFRWKIDNPIDYTSFYTSKKIRNSISMYHEVNSYFICSSKIDEYYKIGILLDLKGGFSLFLAYNEKYICFFGNDEKIRREIELYYNNENFLLEKI